MLCLVPSKIAVMLLRFTSDTAKEALFTVFLSSQVLSFLNSLLNPIIYVVRMRQFRVAFIELLFRTVHAVDAEETEIRLFGVPNAVVRVNRVKAEQDQNEKPQHDVNEEKWMKKTSKKAKTTTEQQWFLTLMCFLFLHHLWLYILGKLFNTSLS